MKTSCTTIGSIALFVLLCCFLSSCTLLNLRKEAQLLEQVTEISGRVEPAGYTGKPLVVVLLAVDPAKPGRTDAVVSRTILKKPGPFKFFAGPGTYRISCFEDLNENGSYQSSEPVGWQDEPKVISVAGGHTVSGLSIVLRPAAEVQRLYPEVLDPAVITAQDRATFIRGYDEDHTSILESGEVITLLQKILAR